MDILAAGLFFLQLCHLWLAISNEVINDVRTNTRRYWVKPQNRVDIRETYGAYRRIFRYYKIRDHEDFFKLTRMSVSQFDKLFKLLKPRLSKSRSRRLPLNPELRLAAVLSLLAHGDSAYTTSLLFSIGRSTMYKLVGEVSQAIWDILQPIVMKTPNTEAEWLIIADDFQKLWNFPNCLGAIDGKHCRIFSPPRSGSFFRNYMKYFSFILMATCDAHYRFTWVDVGDFGSLNDASIFANSTLGKALRESSMGLPEARFLPNSNIRLPFCFVGDEAFPLKSYMLRPYPRRMLLSNKEKIFNYRLSRARRTIENSFGILAARWRILHGPLCMKLQTAETVVLALTCLHNFIMTEELKLKTNERKYGRPGSFDAYGPDGRIIPGEWRNGIPNNMNMWRNLRPTRCHVSPRAVIEQRNALSEYFVSENGKIPWQDYYIENPPIF